MKFDRINDYIFILFWEYKFASAENSQTCQIIEPTEIITQSIRKSTSKFYSKRVERNERKVF